MTAKHPNPSMWWKHRRRMAYTSVIWCIIQTVMWMLVGMFDPEIVGAMGVVIGWSYGVPSTIIIAYFTNTAIDTIKSPNPWSK